MYFPTIFLCKNAMETFVSTSSITMSSMSVSARSCECSLTTCRALVIKFSVSSVLPEDSLSMALRRGKQKEKAGADSGATSKEKNKNTKETKKQSVLPASIILVSCYNSDLLLGLHFNVLHISSHYSLLWVSIATVTFISVHDCAHHQSWPLSVGQCGCAAAVWCGGLLCPGPPVPRPHPGRTLASATVKSRVRRAWLVRGEKK